MTQYEPGPSRPNHSSRPVQAEAADGTLPSVELPSRIQQAVCLWARARADALLSQASEEEKRSTLLQLDSHLTGELRHELPNDPVDRSALFRSACSLASSEISRTILHEQERLTAVLTSREEQLHARIRQLGDELATRIGRSGSFADTENYSNEWAYQVHLLFQDQALQAAVRSTGITPEGGSIHEFITRVVHSVEGQAEAQYLKANVIATTLHENLSMVGSRSSKIFRSLWDLSEVQRILVFQAYNERYGQTFPEAIDQSLSGWKARTKNMIRFSLLREVVAEQYGVEAGVFGAIARFLPNPLQIRDYPQRITETVKSLTEKAKSPEVRRMEALLSGNKIDAAVETLYIALRDRSQVRENLTYIYGKLSADEARIVAARFSKQYARQFQPPEAEHPSLEGAVEHTFRGKRYGFERAYLLSTIQQDGVGALATELDHLVHRGKAAPLAAFLIANHGTLQVRGAQLSQALCQHTDRKASFSERLQRLPHTMQEWVQAAHQGDEARTIVYRLHASLCGLSGEWVGAAFYDAAGRTPKEAIALYKDTLQADFWGTLRKRLGAERTAIMERFVADADLSRAYLVRHCLAGFGADATAVEGILSDITPSQIRSLERAYAKEFQETRLSISRLVRAIQTVARRYRGEFREVPWLEKVRVGPALVLAELRTPRSLRRDIAREFCGHDRFDLEELLEGRTNDPQKLVGRLLKRLCHEYADRLPGMDIESNAHSMSLKGIAQGESCLQQLVEQRERTLARFARRPFGQTVARFFVDSNPDTIRMIADCQAVFRAYHESLADGQVSFFERRRLTLLTELAHQSLDRYRMLRTRTAVMLGNIGALVTAPGASVAFFVMHAPVLPLVAGVGTASLAGRFFLKRRILGVGYGWRQVANDVGLATIDGATFAIPELIVTGRFIRTVGVGTGLNRFVVNGAMKTAFKTVARKFGHSRLQAFLLDERFAGHARRRTEEVEGMKLDSVHIEFQRLQRGLQERIQSIQSEGSVHKPFRRMAKDLF